MQFLNPRPDDSQQWHDYQALELLPPSVQRSPRWAHPFIILRNTMTRFVMALRPAPTTHKAQVAQLEACWQKPLPAAKPPATDDLQPPIPHAPLLWLFDATFDPATAPRRIQRNPADPSTQFWSINDQN